jgi:3-oxoacyl-[acyl-carrier protein] reductase
MTFTCGFEDRKMLVVGGSCGTGNGIACAFKTAGADVYVWEGRSNLEGLHYVNGIAPGLVATKLTRVTVDNPKRLEAALKRIPTGRLGTPQDMVGAVLFQASPFSAYIVGHTIPVDGGLILV